MPLPPTGPYKLIDSLRGIAALAVVAFHVGLSVARNHPELASTHRGVFDLLGGGALGVEVFFVLSGFCIAAAIGKCIDSGRTPVDYARARIRRIFPPYWAVLSLTLAATSAMRSAASAGLVERSSLATQADRWTVPVLGANFALLQTPLHQPSIVAVSWTLTYEWAFYAVLGLLVFPLARSSARIRFAVAHAFTTATALAPWIPGIVVPWPLDLWPAFGAGVAAFDALTNPGNKWSRVAVAMPLGPIFAMAWLPHSVGLEPRPPGAFAAVATVTALVLVAARNYDVTIGGWPGASWMRRVGAFSYSLYLIHFLCIGIVGQLLAKLDLPESIGWAEGVAMGIAALLAGWGFHRLVERRFLSQGKST